ncbi:MAG: SDR family oxidoreductase [Bacteroidales bacterium]|nr:SDR family oxidoreductase [Bacteroidales bacterium]
MKKALFIGGTGTISSYITRLVARTPGWELYLINRGNRPDAVPEGVKVIKADISDEADVAVKLEGMSFDCVCEFIGFVPAHVERDFRLFAGRTKQYMFISTASAYQKPSLNLVVNEATPLANPFWQYSRDKIACEDFLMGKYRSEGYPVTIIRPGHTFDERKLPTAVHGAIGSWEVARRMLAGKKVIVHGDGSSTWTLTHSSDFARAFVGLMGNPHAIGNAYQITSDETMTWDQIYGTVAEALGVEYRPCHVPTDLLASAGRQYDLNGCLNGDKAVAVMYDNSKLKNAVPGFHTEISMAEGLRSTVEYILAHPEYQKPDPEFDSWCDSVVEVMEEAAGKLL